MAGPALYQGRRPVAESYLAISTEFGVMTGDQSLWAESLVSGKRRKLKKAPPSVDLENAITGIHITDTITGSSTIEVTFEDPDWHLVDTGFFDVNDDGKLDAIDVNYPDGSDLWWRCTQISITSTRAGAQIRMMFMERAACYLLDHKGPKKARRGSVTRAEFLKRLTGEVKGGGGIEFVCRNLHKTQPTATTGSTSKVLMVGDSLTVGTGPHLKTELPNRVTYFGTTGASSAAVLKTLKDKLTSAYEVVVFDAGTNDGPSDPSGYRQNLDAALAEVGSNRQMVVLTLNRGGSDMSAMNAEVNDFNADNDNVRLADWGTIGDPFLGTDGTHPNDAGYAKRAEIIADAIGRAEDPHAGLFQAVDDAGHPVSTTGTQSPTNPAHKNKGVHAKDDVTINGHKLNPEQVRQVETTLKVCDELNAPEAAVQGIICAGIGESTFIANRTSSAGAKGVFQLMPFWWSKIDWKDTEKQARYWLQHGYYGKGGGIALANQDYSPGEIATMVEGSGEAGTYYGQFLGEAKKIIAAYASDSLTSGASGGGHYETKQFNFEVGTSSNPHESYWEAMVRLAGDVRWALFVDGSRVFYDPETSLIKQKPALVLHRLDPEVVSFQANWDIRQIATEATLELICDPFEFRAGDVVKLIDFGPGSSGSTVKLPGRWLISDIDRDRFSLSARLTLKQPVKATSEKAAEREWKDDPSDPDHQVGGRTTGVWPGQHDISGPFGTQRPGHIHSGLDVSVPAGTKCTAPFAGTITLVQQSGFGVAGGMVHLRADRNVAGLSQGDKIGWGHCHPGNVHVGQKVEIGQVIGKSNGSPAHVHFVLIKKAGGSLGMGNGVDGNADPTAFLQRIGSIPGGGGAQPTVPGHRTDALP